MATSLMETETLVVEQRRKLFEMRNQYRVFDEDGAQIGAVEQEAQSAFTFLARLGTDMDVALPVTLRVEEGEGLPVLVLHKPWFRMTMSVSRPDGTRLGHVAKRIRLGKARFTLSDASGSEIGEVRAENWRAKDFAVVDTSGNEVARATKKWRGLATEMFTDADTYVVELSPQVSDPLRSLALSAALAIDVVLKQKDY
ncbi:MAG: LURP-one-related/scramblase family protein [Actinomycetota bacterium]